MALIALSVPAPAQDTVLAGLPDPTRPDLGLSLEALLARDPDAGATTTQVTKTAQGDGMVKLPPLLELEYTLVSKKRRIAMINGMAVQEGETVAGAQVLKIRPDQVTLNREGQPLVLELVGYKKKADETKAAAENKSAGVDEAAKAAKKIPGDKGSIDGTK